MRRNNDLGAQREARFDRKSFLERKQRGGEESIRSSIVRAGQAAW